MHSLPASTPPARTRILGCLLLLAALGLRLQGTGYGLDLEDPRNAIHNIQLDERAMVVEELELMGGDWQPGTFLMRGTAPFYLAGSVNAAVLGAVGWMRGEEWSVTVARYELNPSLVFWIHRTLVALCGALTVLVLIRLCRRELGDAQGWIAGILLAAAHMHIQVSHLGLVDVPWVLFAMLAFDRALRLIRSPTASNYLMAGLWIGMAGAVKYPGALVGLPVLAAHFMARRATQRAGVAPPSWRLMASAVGITLATFLAFSPRLLLFPGEYLEAIQTQAEVLDIAEHSSAYGQVLWRHFENSLAVGLGEPVLALAVIGIILALRGGVEARRITWLALLMLPTALVAKDPAPRFATGLLVAFVPLATIGFMGLLGSAPSWAKGAALVLCISPSLVRTLATQRVLGRPDTRPEMMAELARRGLDADAVLGIGHRGLPVVVGAPSPFVSFLREMRMGRMTVADVLAAPPAYVLRDLSSGVPDAIVWEPFRQLVEEGYEEVYRVDARGPRIREPAPQGYYLIPRSFVPFRSPWSSERPGPALALYRRTANR